MAPMNHRGSLLPQEEHLDAIDQVTTAQPYTQNEIEDLLYGDERPVEERIARLREMRSESVTRESGDWGDEDPASLISEIDRAIDELSGDSATSDDNFELEGVLADDPANHSHALSPDDVDALRELSGEEDFLNDDDAQTDDEHWAGSEEFRKDVH